MRLRDVFTTATAVFRARLPALLLSRRELPAVVWRRWSVGADGSLSVRERAWEKVRRGRAWARSRASRGHPAPAAARAANRARAGAPGARGQGRTPLPAPSASLGCRAPAGTARLSPGCPRRPRGASCRRRVRRAGAAAGECRSGSAAAARPGLTAALGPPPQHPGLGGCDNGL